jgi:hypothetical protein
MAMPKHMRQLITWQERRFHSTMLFSKVKWNEMKRTCRNQEASIRNVLSRVRLSFPQSSLQIVPIGPSPWFEPSQLLCLVAHVQAFNCPGCHYNLRSDTKLQIPSVKHHHFIENFFYYSSFDVHFVRFGWVRTRLHGSVFWQSPHGVLHFL